MTTDTPSTPLRLGVLGCASIARGFIRDVAASPAVSVVAVASRSLDNARAFAEANGVGRAHGSYEELLADADVDAIYLPLPNSLHAEWAIRAADAGKHVLCEKPLALDRDEAAAMFAAAEANRVVLLEAYPYWFQPQTGALVQLLCEGAIGELRSVQASFGFTVPNRDRNIRMKPELGGGALLDAGSYVASLIRLVMGSAPQQVSAEAVWDPSGVDIATLATLRWDDGRRAQLSCAMDGANHRRATLIGSAGAIETEFLNHTAAPGEAHPYGYLPSQMRVRRGIANTIAFDTIDSPAGSGFRFEAEAFARLVRERDLAAARRAAAASIDIAAMLDAIARSARSAQAVRL